MKLVVVSATMLLSQVAIAGLVVPLEVAEDAGVERAPGLVTSGVPFPMGALKSVDTLRLRDEQGGLVPAQMQATATWRDGSVKWVLLDFLARVPPSGTRRFLLESGVPSAPAESPAAIRVATNGPRLRVTTDRLELVFSREHAGFLESARRTPPEGAAADNTPTLLEHALAVSLRVTNELAGKQPVCLPPESLTIEEHGPVRVVVKAVGWLSDGGTNRLVRYTTRVHIHGASETLRIQHTITQLSDSLKMLWVAEHALAVPCPGGSARRYSFGGESAAHRGGLAAGQRAVLAQLSESRYTVRSPAGAEAAGLKAAGWASVADGQTGVTVAVRDFWQQHPKTLEVSSGGFRLGLHPAEAQKPWDMDQGLAKTHEILIYLEGAGASDEGRAALARALAQPLFAVAPAAWYCESKVFGTLLPFDFDRFPDYETLTEASGDQFIKRMTTGSRHWGDVYYGGEFKGTNSYTNLEYDMHHNFLCQFARTGLKKYLRAALVMAQHQADIDTNHKTGWQWKHSPRHTEIQAEFGHTFTRGLLEAWFLGGNRLCLEAATTLGDYFARDIRNPRSLGNERQIGWALISLLPVYEATWDRRYFEAASNTVERLLAGLDARGRFNIRWDNRIAFFNGIAATGFLYYHRATGDERVADAAYRVIRRARGFYPEYHGRTLEAIAWAWERTSEPAWLDFLARTWETTLAQQVERNAMDLGAPTIFTVHALPGLLQAGVLPPVDQPLGLSPAQFDSYNGLHARHLPWHQGELFLELKAGEPLDLVLIRKGSWKGPGQARLYDPQGELQESFDFPRENQVWQRKSFRLAPTASGPWRLAFDAAGAQTTRGGSAVTWDVVTSRPVRGVFATPRHRGLEFVTPALFCAPSGSSRRIELEVAGEGEGFKRAVIRNPAGQVAGSVEAFIDLGDKGRYFYKVAVEVPPSDAQGVWSVVLEGVTLETARGLTPYYATSPASFFRPDRP